MHNIATMFSSRFAANRFAAGNYLKVLALSLMLFVGIGSSWAATYYPSSAGGNWAAGASWSTASCGGAACTCTPTTTSDVISLSCAKTITVAASVATGGDITISGGTLIVNSGITLSCTSLTMTSGTLTILGTGSINITSGNFSITGGTFTQGAGTVAFLGSNQTIASNQSFYNLNISGTGSKTMNSDITVTNTLALTAATLVVGANTLTLSGNTPSYVGGAITLASASSLTLGGTNAAVTDFRTTYHLTNTYPISFNNFTDNSANQINFAGNVTLAGTLTQTAGTLVANGTSSAVTITANAFSQSGGTFNMGHSSGATTLAITTGFTMTGGTFYCASSSVASGTPTETVNVGGNFIISGTSTNFTMINSGNSGNVNVTVTGNTTMSGTSMIRMENASNTTYNAIFQTTDFGCTATGTTSSGPIDFGTGTITGNEFRVKGNFTKSGAGNFYTSGSTAALGIVFNGTGVQNLNNSSPSSSGNYVSYLVNAGSTVKLLSSLIITSTGSNPPSSFTINGTLDCGTFAISGSATTTFNLASAANLITANTAGVFGTSSSINISTAANATFNGGANYTFNSTVAGQTTNFKNITAASGTTMNNLIINNTAGNVTLNTGDTVAGILTLTAGNLVTGSNMLYVSNNATTAVVRTTPSTSGYIVGNLQRAIATGINTYVYDIGTLSYYAPVTLAYTGVTGAGRVLALATAGQHPTAGSPVNNTKDVAAYWTLTNNATATVTGGTYVPTFGYVSGALFGSPTQSAFVLANYVSAAWSASIAATNAGSGTLAAPYTTLDNSSLSTYGDFVAGELNVSPTLAASAIGTTFGNICTSQSSTAGSNSFSLSASSNLTAADVVVGPLTGFTFSSTSGSGYVGTLNIPTSAGTVSSSTVYVQFNPTLVQSYSGNIPVSGGGASAINVPETAAGINTAPTVTTPTSASITTTTATLGGNQTVLGCTNSTEQGIYWSTVSGFTPPGSGTKVSTTGSFTTGVFTQAVTGLPSGTPIYFQAFSTNNGGTAFSAQGSFTTACSIASIPQTENFSATTIPSCWASANVTTPAVAFVYGTGQYVDLSTVIPPYGGSGNYVWWNSYTNSGAQQRLTALPISTSGTSSVDVDFAWYESTNGTSTSYLTEGVTVQWSANGTTWNNSTFFRRYGTVTGWQNKVVTLPAGAGNQATLYVAFLFTSNAGYNSALDAVVIQPTPPTLVSSSPSLTFGNVCTSASSTAGSNSFSLSTSNNLTAANVTVGPLTGFTFCSTPTGAYTSSLTLSTSAGTVTNPTVYVQFNPTLVQSYSGNIPVSGGGATAINVAETAAGSNSAPTVGNGTVGTLLSTSVVLNGTLTFAGCGGSNTYGFEYSTTSGFANGAGTPVASTNLSGTAYSSTISTLTQATTYYYHAYASSGVGTVYGTIGSFTTPCTVNTLPQTENFTAATLPTCWASANVTTPAVAFVYSSTQTVDGTVAIPAYGGSGNYVWWNSYSNSGAQQRLTALPVTSVGVSSVDVNFAWYESTNGTSSSYTTEGVTVQWSTNGTTWNNSTFFRRYGAVTGWQNKTVTLPVGAAGQSTLYVAFLFTSNAGYNSALDAVVIKQTPPTLVSSSPSLTFGNICTATSTTAGSNSFSLSTSTFMDGTNVTVGPLAGFQFSSTSGSGYANSLTLATNSGTGAITNPLVYVQFSPTLVQSYSGNIPVSGGGATAINVAETATGVNTAPTVTTPTSASITTTTATLGGNQTVLGCSSSTEQGIYWSTTSGFTPPGAGTKVFTSGTFSTGVFTQAVTGLPSGTPIYYKAFATSASGTGFSAQGTFTTVCAAISTFPYTEGFEGITTANTLPSCMVSSPTVASGGKCQTYIASATGTNSALIARNGSKFAAIYYSPSATQGYFFSPGLQLTGGTSYTASVYYKTDGVAWTTAGLYYGSAATPAGMTNTITTVSNAIATGYTQITSTFTPSSSGTYYVAFSAYNSTTSPNYISFDDFSVDVTPACVAPTAVSVTGVTTSAATVNFTCTSCSPGNAYIVEYGASGFTPGTGATAGGGTVVTGSATGIATGTLSANTAYQVYVRQDCGAGSYSANSTVVAFTTLCNVSTLPQTENFVGATTPACWSPAFVATPNVLFVYGTGQYVDLSTVIPPYGGSGNYVWYNSYTNSGAQTRLVSLPVTSTGVGSVDVDFAWYESTNGTSTSYLTEGVTVQYSINGTTWTNSTFFRRYGAATGWQNKTVTLPVGAANQGTLYVAFLFTSNAGYNSALDAVSIHATPAPGCVSTFVPANGATYPTNTAISWTAVSGASSYDVYFSTVASDVNTSAPAAFIGNQAGVTYTPSGMTNGTYYWKAVPKNVIGSATGCATNSFTAMAPLCGTTYTINNLVATGGTNFNSFTDAFNALNGVGITCATKFKVKDGQVFNELVPALTATGTSTNTITFVRDSSGGTHPKIQGTTGVGAADAVVQLKGSDYIIIDGIDLYGNAANTTAITRMEYGLFLNGQATNGCQHNVLQNSAISLNVANTNTTHGVHVSSTATSSTGENNSNYFLSNNVQNAIVGYSIIGNSSYDDLDNQVKGAGSTIQNIGSASVSTTAVGVDMQYQEDYFVSNTTINNVVSGGSAYGISSTNGYYNVGNIFNDKITNITGGSTSQAVGIYATTGQDYDIENDTIQGVTSGAFETGGIEIYSYDYQFMINNIVGGTGSLGITGGSVVHGILADGGVAYIQGNTINNIVTTNGASNAFGVQLGTGTEDFDDNYVIENKISSIKNTGATSTSVVAGIDIQGLYYDQYTFVANNMVSDIRNDNANGSGAPAVRGISVREGEADTYYNTVYLSGTCTNAAFEAAAFYMSYNGGDNYAILKNNILYNTYNVTAGAKASAIAFSSTDARFATEYSSNSNNNLLYAGVPSAKNIIYTSSTGTKQTLANYQTLSRDANSLSGLVKFVNTTTLPYDLNPDSTTNCLISGKGLDLSVSVGITDDINGAVRHVGTSPNGPDLGAAEFNFNPQTKTSTFTNPVCQGSAVSVVVSTQAPTPTYAWTVPSTITNPGAASSYSSAAAVLANAGHYAVTVTDGLGCTSTFDSLMVVNPLPTGNAGSNTPVCVGSTLNLTSPSAATYTWSGPNSFASTNALPSISNVSAAAAGTYSVTATTGAGCSVVKTTSVTVNATPTVTASNTGPYVQGQTIQLNSTSTISGGTFSWAGPNSYTAATQNPTISPADIAHNGVYTVTGTTALGCTATNTTTVYVGPNITIWTSGAGTTDWFTLGNWTSGLPAVTANLPSSVVSAVIPAGVLRYPIITGIAGQTATVKDVQIQLGGSLTVQNLNGVNLEVYGDFDNRNTASSSLGVGKVIFKGTVAQHIDGNSTFGGLDINNSNGVILSSGTTKVSKGLNLVSGVLTTGGHLTISSAASGTGWVDNFTSGNNGSVSGNMTVQRFVVNPGANYSFFYVGSPVNGGTVTDWSADFSNPSINNAIDGSQVIPDQQCTQSGLIYYSPYAGIFDFRENTVTNCNLQGWHTRFSGSSVNGQGFAARIPDGTTIDMTGTMNVGNITSPTLTRTANNTTSTKGFNLVSNPYAAPLDWMDVAAANVGGIQGTAYMYETQGAFAGTYLPVNALSGNTQIASSQAFFVDVATSQTSTNINFTKSMERSGPTNNYLRTARVYDNLLTLDVTGNGYADKARIAFGTNFTAGFDREYDARKMKSRTGQPSMFVTYGNEEFSIFANTSTEDVKDVPVAFDAGGNGTYTITANDLGTFDANTVVTLEDLKLHVTQNLVTNPKYTFSADVNDNASRFVIHFRAKTVDGVSTTVAAGDENVKVSGVKNTVSINFSNFTSMDEVTVNIFDVVGRKMVVPQQIATGNNHATINVSDAVSGYYFVVLTGKEGYEKAEKVFLTNEK